MKKISFKELFQLQNEKFEEYHNVLKHLEPNPISKKLKSLTDLNFGEVVGIKLGLQNPSFENVVGIFKTAFGLKEQNIFKLDVIQFYQSINWIQEEITAIYQRESENLSSEPDSQLKDAGVENLNIFGEMNTLIMLGKEFGKSPQEIESWSYNLVFGLMLHHKITNDINKRYAELNKPNTND